MIYQPTTEQLENRKRAAAGLPVITADDLTTTPSLDITEPTPTATPTLPEYKPMELTAPEQEVSSAQKRIMELRGETVGESALKTQLEEERGISGKETAITDMEAEFEIIKAEQLQLQEQQRMIPLQLQEEAKGRGITAGGLRPLETGRLRTLAIRQGMVSSKGLFKLAELQGARGNLSTSLELVDRAVKAKYDPIREKLDVEQANLKMLLESPELSLADKNRAIQLQLQLSEREREIATQEAEEKRKGEFIVEVAELGGSALLLREISQATTHQQAMEIVADSGIRVKGLTQMEQAKIASEEALAEQRRMATEKIRRELGGEGGDEDLNNFRQFIQDNPNATRAEIKASGFENTDLSVSQINAELDSAGVIEEKVKFTSEQIKNIAVAVVKSLTKTFKGGEIGRAKELIQNGVLEINNKTVKLSAKQIQQILSEIDIQYPEGQRGIMERVLPWGK